MYMRRWPVTGELRKVPTAYLPEPSGAASPLPGVEFWAAYAGASSRLVSRFCDSAQAARDLDLQSGRLVDERGNDS